MSEVKKPLKAATEVPRVTAEQVAEYLQKNPDFFVLHTRLLTDLSIPHPTGPAISLIERQVQLLRERNHKLHVRLDELVDLARGNEAMVERLHRLAVDLLQAPDLETRLEAVTSRLLTDFNADELTIVLFRGPADIQLPPKARVASLNEIEQLADLRISGRPRCGVFPVSQMAKLFGPEAGRVASAALIPLGERGDTGIIGIGSHKRERFGRRMGTLFLTRMGEVIGTALESTF
jgi:uncharacterized protein YigA (DUF484 family)